MSPLDFGRFYLPLAATSLLLTATNPLLAAALARGTDPAAALAGFSVAFAFTGVLYAPLLVVQQVAAARLLEGRGLVGVRRFALAGGLLLSLVAAGVAWLPPLGSLVFGRAVGVTGSVYGEAMAAVAFLWPVPFLTGLRALHQGRLVAGRRTRPIAAATGARTAVLATVAFVLTLLSSGAWLGAVAFTIGLTVEVLVVYLAGREIAPAGPEPHPPAPDQVILFSAPLILNVVLWWSTPLILSAVLARTPEPDRALAAFAVVEAVAWFVTAPVGQLQHAGIALVDGRPSHRRVRAWAGALALLVALLLGTVALPALREPVLRAGFALEPGILDAVGTALPLAVAYPLLYGHRQYYQGLFVRAGCPRDVGVGAVLRIGAILVAAVLLLEPMGSHGAALGVGLAAGGLAVEGLWLERRSHVRALPALDELPPAPSRLLTT